MIWFLSKMHNYIKGCVKIVANGGASSIAVIFLFLFKKGVVILPNQQCNNSS